LKKYNVALLPTGLLCLRLSSEIFPPHKAHVAVVCCAVGIAVKRSPTTRREHDPIAIGLEIGKAIPGLDNLAIINTFSITTHHPQYFTDTIFK
jgi:hypothetical protein